MVYKLASIILYFKVLKIRIDAVRTFNKKTKEIKNRLIHDATIQDDELQTRFLQEVRLQIVEANNNKIKELEQKHKERFCK